MLYTATTLQAHNKAISLKFLINLFFSAIFSDVSRKCIMLQVTVFHKDEM